MIFFRDRQKGKRRGENRAAEPDKGATRVFKAGYEN